MFIKPGKIRRILAAAKHILKIPTREIRQLWKHTAGKISGKRKQIIDSSEENRIRGSGLFDPEWYQSTYSDVVRSGMDPLHHYLVHGWFEARYPGPDFAFYNPMLSNLRNFKKNRINPLIHYTRIFEDKVSFEKSDSPDIQFFFIIGTGRSGTTLMARILNAHSQICVPHEIQIVFEWSGNGKRLAETFISGKNLEYGAEDYIKLIRERCPHDFQKYFDYPAFFHRLRYPISSLRGLLTGLYSEIARSQSKTIFAEQTPWYGQNIPLLNQLFPTARYIHMVRDGRDVAISYARTPWWSDDVFANLEQWDSQTRIIERDASNFLGERMLTVRYEDLILHPDNLIGQVCEFLQVPYEAGMLNVDNHVDYSRYRKAGTEVRVSNAYEKWSQEKTSAIFSGSMYAWKKQVDVDFSDLPPSIRQMLKKYGYEVP